jgi:hypothetical protein
VNMLPSFKALKSSENAKFTRAVTRWEPHTF